MSTSSSSSRSGITQSDSVLREKIVKQVNLWLKRPARRQADPDATEQTQKVYEGTFNIWYNKWTGQKHKGRFEFGERAPSRVNIARDTGFTLADKRKQQNPTYRTSFCLFFARGNCPRGHKCEYLHRIPLPDDPEDTMKDCFARERTRDERDDNNGVGSFNRESRTLYIGGMHPYEKGEAEKILRKHFIAFGPIDRLNVIYDKTIAFVRYEKRSNAEFAKEAMEHQALDAGEVIRIRWANDDPNPREIEANKKRREHEFIQSYVTKKTRTGEIQYMDDETKQLIESNPIYQQFYSSYGEVINNNNSVLLTTTETTTTSETETETTATTEAETTGPGATTTDTETITTTIATNLEPSLNNNLVAYTSDDED